MKKIVSVFTILAILLSVAVHYIDYRTMINKKDATVSMSIFSLYLSVAIYDENYLIKHPTDIKMNNDVADEIEKTLIALGGAEPLYSYYGVNHASAVKSIMLYLLEYNDLLNRNVIQYFHTISPAVKQFTHKNYPSINEIDTFIRQLYSAYVQKSRH